MPDIPLAKHRAARQAASLVQPDMVVGLGSGSTAALVISALGERVAQGLRVVGVATSQLTAALACHAKIELRGLDDVVNLDLNIDGADEVDPEFRMIKGKGGALLREKLVASVARRRVTVITPEKRVARLGAAPIPVEVCPVGVHHTERRLKALGAETRPRRLGDGRPFLTDNGNPIIDCRFSPAEDPVALDSALQNTIGVFETGLFVGLCDLLIVGHEDRVETLESTSGTRVETL